MDNKSALQLEVEKEMGFEIDEDLFAYLEHYARRKLEVANKSAGRAWGEDGYGDEYLSLLPLPQAVPNSFAEWMNATDYEFVITHPEGYELAPQFVGNAKVEYDQMKAFEGADFIYAKNWAAYSGDNYGQILSKDRDWTVSDRQMAVTNNAYFMHCLPVRRNMIVTDDVIESPQSIVIPEAANREISATVVLKRLLEGLK